MPKFLIAVASPVFPKMKFLYKNVEYSQRCTAQFDFPSCHLNGKKDTFAKNLTCHTLFKGKSEGAAYPPQVVEFNEGHKFPRRIDDENFASLKQFVKDMYVQKNNNEDGFEVDYEKYNFEVRF